MKEIKYIYFFNLLNIIIELNKFVYKLIYQNVKKSRKK